MRNAETAERAPVVPADSASALVRHGTHKPGTRVTSMALPALPALPVLGQSASPVAPAPDSLGTVSLSRLAEQNDLFSAAMAAERQGQHDLALHQLDDLIARFPSGPLNESARAERQRILAAQGLR
jgi:hypothetical protein